MTRSVYPLQRKFLAGLHARYLEMRKPQRAGSGVQAGQPGAGAQGGSAAGLPGQMGAAGPGGSAQMGGQGASGGAIPMGQQGGLQQLGAGPMRMGSQVCASAVGLPQITCNMCNICTRATIVNHRIRTLHEVTGVFQNYWPSAVEASNQCKIHHTDIMHYGRKGATDEAVEQGGRQHCNLRRACQSLRSSEISGESIAHRSALPDIQKSLPFYLEGSFGGQGVGVNHT